MHTGIVTFVTVGVYAVLFIWGVRFAAAKLVTYPPTATVGKAVGAIVHFA